METEEFQENIKRAFQAVKKDITEINDKLQNLTEKQEKLEANLHGLIAKIDQEIKPTSEEILVVPTPQEDLIQIREPEVKKPKKVSKKKAKGRKK